MTPTYEILHFFESPALFIAEIKVQGVNNDVDLSLKFHWLYYDRVNGALIKLWFKSMDSSPSVEERYFEQGFLKFTAVSATFIEKFNSSQHTLDNRSDETPNPALLSILDSYFLVY